MKISLSIVILCAVCCTTPALAQNWPSRTTNDYRREFYAFIAPGLDSTRTERQAGTGPLFSVGAGVGFERFVHNGLALGAEYARASTPSRWDYSAATDKTNYNRTRWAMFNGAYHFRNIDPAGEFAPFVTGGLGTMSLARAGAAIGGNYGAGVHWWRTRHVGLRVELRRHVVLNEERGRFTGVRFGLAIR